MTMTMTARKKRLGRDLGDALRVRAHDILAAL